MEAEFRGRLCLEQLASLCNEEVQREFCSYEEGRMTYTGTILEDLQNIVDDLLKRSARICVICRQPYGYHSAIGRFCPDAKSVGPGYLHSRFVETVANSPRAV